MKTNHMSYYISANQLKKKTGFLRAWFKVLHRCSGHQVEENILTLRNEAGSASQPPCHPADMLRSFLHAAVLSACCAPSCMLCPFLHAMALFACFPIVVDRSFLFLSPTLLSYFRHGFGCPFLTKRVNKCPESGTPYPCLECLFPSSKQGPGLLRANTNSYGLQRGERQRLLRQECRRRLKRRRPHLL